MKTPRVALHVAAEPDRGHVGQRPDPANDPDPLRRLEAELQRSEGGRVDGERLHEQAWTLLEEAWGLLTECLVMRDGLLDACHEIEQTMEGIQKRLGGLPTGLEASRENPTSAAERGAVSGSHGVVVPR
jgi:hypothetical protein